jgi:hypothetical protein
MAEEWDALKDEIIATIKTRAKQFTDVESGPMKDFVEEVGKDFAKQKWISINGTDTEKAEAKTNLEELNAQVKGRFKKLQLSLLKEAEFAIGAVLETVGDFLMRVGPEILKKVT